MTNTNNTGSNTLSPSALSAENRKPIATPEIRLGEVARLMGLEGLPVTVAIEQAYVLFPHSYATFRGDLAFIARNQARTPVSDGGNDPEDHALSASGEDEFPIYTPDQQRTCDYLQEIAPDIGCGLDPVGFLIASHGAVRAQRDEAQSAVTAWQQAVESLEAHIMDRIAMKDLASPETYLRILKSDVAIITRVSEQIVAARWSDYASQRQRIERLEAQLADRTPVEDGGARIAELEAALKPFALKISDEYDDGEPYRSYFGVKEIRQALAALATSRGDDHGR